jgi:hypothetical protein
MVENSYKGKATRVKVSIANFCLVAESLILKSVSLWLAA